MDQSSRSHVFLNRAIRKMYGLYNIPPGDNTHPYLDRLELWPTEVGRDINNWEEWDGNVYPIPSMLDHQVRYGGTNKVPVRTGVQRDAFDAEVLQRWHQRHVDRG